MHSELSVAYHGYALEFVLSAAILSKQNGMPLSKDFDDCIGKGADILAAMQRPNGTWPNMGDRDGGRLHFLSRNHPCDFRPLLETASKYASGSSSPSCSGSYPETFWMLGAQPEHIKADECGGRGSKYFPASGIAISRSSKGLFSAFQCGKFGYKDSPHSHADMLHIDISVGMDNFIIDPGTYVYSSDMRLRNEFRSAERHNGPALEEPQIMNPDDPFGWQLQPDCIVSHCYSGNRSDYISASCPVIRPKRGDAVIQRSILFVRDLFWVIFDKIETMQPCRFGWTFTTPYPIDKQKDHSIIKGAAGDLAVIHALMPGTTFDRSVAEASYSEDYFNKKSGFALHYQTAPLAAAQAVFVLIPSQSGLRPNLTPSITGDEKRTVISFSIGDGNYSISAGNGPSELAGIATDAEMAVIAMKGSVEHSAIAAHATTLTGHEIKLLKSSSIVDYADMATVGGERHIETTHIAAFPNDLNRISLLKNLAS
jgi:hypothetical protein